MVMLRQDIQTIRALAERVAHERNDTVEGLLGRLNGIRSRLGRPVAGCISGILWGLD